MEAGCRESSMARANTVHAVIVVSSCFGTEHDHDVIYPELARPSMGEFSTTLPAASLEFCPTGDLWNYFVCGTYKLDEPPNSVGVGGMGGVNSNKQTRVGKCLLFQAGQDGRL